MLLKLIKFFVFTTTREAQTYTLAELPRGKTTLSFFWRTKFISIKAYRKSNFLCQVLKFPIKAYRKPNSLFFTKC